MQRNKEKMLFARSVSDTGEDDCMLQRLASVYEGEGDS